MIRPLIGHAAGAGNVVDGVAPDFHNVDAGQPHIGLDMIFQCGIKRGDALPGREVLIKGADGFGDAFQALSLLVNQNPVQGGQVNQPPDGHGQRQAGHGQRNQPHPERQIVVVIDDF